MKIHLITLSCLLILAGCITSKNTQNPAVDPGALYPKDKWGVIDSRGNEVLGAQFDRLAVEPGWQMALIEFEPNRLGYKHFNGTEYFKRKK